MMLENRLKRIETELRATRTAMERLVAAVMKLELTLGPLGAKVDLPKRDVPSKDAALAAATARAAAELDPTPPA